MKRELLSWAAVAFGTDLFPGVVTSYEEIPPSGKAGFPAEVSSVTEISSVEVASILVTLENICLATSTKDSPPM
jgi:hypothetical protein